MINLQKKDTIIGEKENQIQILNTTLDKRKLEDVNVFGLVLENNNPTDDGAPSGGTLVKLIPGF